ncbi:MAG: hypothetical protein IID08_08425 [Candidatus Hydrogenedentes bacterium]|nr:hypothetical protein [Candidatus Hydrogenedentota bacterium]
MNATGSRFHNSLWGSRLVSRTHIVTTGLLMVLLLGVPGLAWAGDGGRFQNERLILRAGIFFADYDSRIRFDDSLAATLGTDIDLERDLGLDESEEVFTGELVLRLTHRQRFEFGYMSFGRSASKLLSFTIEFGGETFDASTNVATTLDIDVYRFAYGYSFVNSGTTEFGVTIGVHVLDIKASIVDTAMVAINEKTDVTAPLPNIGVYAGRVLTKSLAVVGKVQLFLVEVDEFDGQLVNATVALEYLPFRRISGGHLLIGGGYSLFDLDFESTSTDFPGGFDFEVSGPIVYGGVRF